MSPWGFYICSFWNNGFSFPRWLSPAGLDLAEHLLTFNPALRATAVQALDASYFKQEQPPPELPTGYVCLINISVAIFLILFPSTVWPLSKENGTNLRPNGREPRNEGGLKLLLLAGRSSLFFDHVIFILLTTFYFAFFFIFSPLI